MSDIAAFIAARLDEKEALAKAVSAPANEVNWYVCTTTLHDMDRYEHAEDAARTALATCFGPVWALRDIAAKRAILREHTTWEGKYGPDPCGVGDPSCLGCGLDSSEELRSPRLEDCPTLRALAAADSDHPDYHPGWAEAE